MQARPADHVWEREAELAALDAVLDATVQLAAPLVVVLGPPGIGKTTLLGLASACAAERGRLILSARGSVTEQDYPFGIAQQLCGPAFAASPADVQAAALAIAGPAASALGLAGPLRPDVDVSFALLHGLHGLTVRLAGDAPLLIVVDDVQWADVESLRFLLYLAMRIAQPAGVLLLASRHPPPDANPLLTHLLDLPGATRLEPAALSSGASAAFLRDAAGDEVSSAFARAAHEATGGNPFLLNELARAAATGVVDPQRVGDLHELALPAVARSLRSRLGPLSRSAVSLCRAVAVLGGAVTLPRAARVADLPLEHAAHLLDELVAADVLAVGPPGAFVHPLVRAAVIDTWPVGDQVVMRRRAALVLAGEGEVERAALQLLEVPPAGDGEVVGVLRTGAVAALQRGGADAAARLLRRALQEPPPATERGQLLREAATAGRLAGDATSLELFRQHLSLLDDCNAVTNAEVELGWWLMWAGRFEEALSLFDRHLDLAYAAGDLLPEAMALAAAQLSRPEIAPARAARLRQHARAVQSAPPSVTWVLAAMDAMSGRPAAAPAAAGAARAWCGAPSSPPPPNFVYLAFALVLTEQNALAHRLFDSAADEARRAGAVPQFSLASTWAGWGAYGCGDLLASETHARAALAAGGLGVWGGISPAAVALLAEVQLVQGELDAAEEVLAEYGLLDGLPDGFVYARPRYARGLLHAARGRSAAALDDLTATGALVQRHGCPTPAWIPWRSAAAGVLVATGDRTEARRLAEEEVQLARKAHLPSATSQALRAVAYAVTDVGQTIDLYSEAVAAVGDSDARLARALALVDLGAALRRGGQRTACRAPLLAGLDLAARCHARSLVSRAREELHASGAHPRRTALTGSASLTHSERRVVDLAATGRTNRQIADLLVVSPKTVEKHLAAAFRKLQVTRREQLAESLSR